MKTFLTCLLTFMAAVAVAQTKINVTLDHADAMYKCNEQAVFTVTMAVSSALSMKSISPRRIRSPSRERWNSLAF